jgi:hypothetical protein
MSAHEGRAITCSSSVVAQWTCARLGSYSDRLPSAVDQMQAAARAAATPLPPVVLPPAQAVPPSMAPVVQQAEVAAGDTSSTAAAAVANLGLQLPVEHGPVLAGDSADGMDSGLPAPLLSMAHHAREVPDQPVAARA